MPTSKKRKGSKQKIASKKIANKKAIELIKHKQNVQIEKIEKHIEELKIEKAKATAVENVELTNKMQQPASPFGNEIVKHSLAKEVERENIIVKT